jgi:endonuclease YncB( thermonuclease family)
LTRALGLVLSLGCAPAAVTDTGVGTDTPVTADTAAEAREADDARVRALGGAALPVGGNPCAPPMLVRVDYAVDGDTFYATPDDGSPRVKVRLIGIDTPEIAHDDPAECFGDEAHLYTHTELRGRLAWLTFDRDCTDVYDRTLAYVHRDLGDDGFFNRRLVRAGYATHLEVAPNTTFADAILGDERAARAERAGLWGACSR